MGLTAGQLANLKTADQRFQAHIVVFDEYVPTVTPPAFADLGTLLTPKPIPRCTPRYSVVDFSETQHLYGRDSYNRGISYVGDANISFALQGGDAGSLVDNGDGTADFTAPANGAGTSRINFTVTNPNGSKIGRAFVQYPKTTNDEIVAEVASFGASIDKHGWEMTVRARGDVSTFTIGKLILLHVEDTWDGTTSTFGGYKYPEGQIVGYISAADYFEDGSGETWLGLAVSSPWDYILAQIKVGETLWGSLPESGKFYLPDFAPVDAIYHFVNEIVDWTIFHDAVLFLDKNQVEGFIIDQSDLATIIDDVMSRTLCISYVDRYSALYCVPDPDVRAGEFWGTPAPTFDSGGAGALTEEFVMDYTLPTLPTQRVKKLVLEAYDVTQLGLWAQSEITGGIGDIKTIRGLLCDDPLRLASWAALKRAQMNREWELNVNLPLNHVMDLVNFADVNFTSPGQANGLTASGQTWVHSMAYRPDSKGEWQGGWRLLKNTSGDIDGSSGWSGGGGIAGIPKKPYTGSVLISGDGGGWAEKDGGVTSFCHLFEFSGGTDGGWSDLTRFITNPGGPRSIYASNEGWRSTAIGGAASTTTAERLYPERYFASRIITGMKLWVTNEIANHNLLITDIDNTILTGVDPLPSGNTVVSWAAAFESSLSYISVRWNGQSGAGQPEIFWRSAQICGSGSDPF